MDNADKGLECRRKPFVPAIDELRLYSEIRTDPRKNSQLAAGDFLADCDMGKEADTPPVGNETFDDFIAVDAHNRGGLDPSLCKMAFENASIGAALGSKDEGDILQIFCSDAVLIKQGMIRRRYDRHRFLA